MKPKNFFVALLVATLLTGCSTSESDNSKASAEDKTEEATKETAKSVYGVGETAEVNGVKITVNSAETVDQVDDMVNTADRLDEGSKYEVIDITIDNQSDEAIKVSSMVSFELKDQDGRSADYQLPMGDGQLDGEVDQGDKLSGQQIYQVPAEGELILTYRTGLGGDKVKFQVR
ncbi:MAG TPA: hypothetical protein DCP49_01995 [Erysipelotrichaceae bacterium]|nr:hypothetical protein [Erysipelotrichaceae bacterium]